MSIEHTQKPVEPDHFTRDQLEWAPWLEPVDKQDLSDDQIQALVDAARANSDYFRLLVHDPDILEARTRADKDIFYNTKDGLPRAERELAAAAVSRFNGCIYCASVHARFSAQYSKQVEAIDQLLEQGVETKLNPLWDAIVKASVKLSQTPVAFSEADIADLVEAGLEPDAISDLIHAASFFNWANRLMLSLGYPYYEDH